jgi:prophage regulatory protein
MNQPVRFMRVPEVIRLLGITRNSLYDLIARGEFPRAVKLSYKLAVWPETDVINWQQQKIAEREK